MNLGGFLGVGILFFRVQSDLKATTNSLIFPSNNGSSWSVLVSRGRTYEERAENTLLRAGIPVVPAAMTSSAPAPRVTIARPSRSNGVLSIPASATQKGNVTDPEGLISKPATTRLKINVRRLPPGLTQAEFEEALGDEWKVNGGKVDWTVYKEGKVSKEYDELLRESGYIFDADPDYSVLPNPRGRAVHTCT